ncbi:MAG TPA: hypothetical protein PK765_05720 [bacterium]|nr:hypothetical protein [bacterium]
MHEISGRDVRIIESLSNELQNLATRNGEERIVVATGSLYFVSTFYPLLTNMGLFEARQ